MGTNDVRMRYYFRQMGLDMEIDNLSGIFEFLDMDNDGKVDADEFTTAIQFLHGPVRAIEIARIQQAVRKNYKLVEKMQQTLEELRLRPPAIAPFAVVAPFTEATPPRTSNPPFACP